MFEKIVNSKINEVADWIIRLIMINIMVIFTSLAVVTILPAVSAGYAMLGDYADRKNPRLFADYFRYFKQNIGKKILFEVIMVLAFALIYLNIRYYDLSLQESPTTFLWIGYYISLALVAILFAVTLYSVIVMKVRSEMGFIKMFKFSIFLAGKYYPITMLLVIITFSPFLLVLYPTSFTSLVFIFLGISLPLLLNAMLTRRVVKYIEKLGENNG